VGPGWTTNGTGVQFNLRSPIGGRFEGRDGYSELAWRRKAAATSACTPARSAAELSNVRWCELW
jgi:hypothetical protein